MATEGKVRKRRVDEPQGEQRSVREVIEESDELDRRRRIQVDTQKQVINRLLANSSTWSWGEEQELLMREVVESRARLEAIADYVASQRYSSIARKVLKLCGDV